MPLSPPFKSDQFYLNFLFCRWKFWRGCRIERPPYNILNFFRIQPFYWTPYLTLTLSECTRESKLLKNSFCKKPFFMNQPYIFALLLCNRILQPSLKSKFLKKYFGAKLKRYPNNFIFDFFEVFFTNYVNLTLGRWNKQAWGERYCCERSFGAGGNNVVRWQPKNWRCLGWAAGVEKIKIINHWTFCIEITSLIFKVRFWPNSSQKYQLRKFLKSLPKQGVKIPE